MVRTTIIFGLLLTALGAGGYFGVTASFEALVPAICGVVLLVLAVVALVKGSLRKHAMHAAALVALVGLAANIFGTVELIRRVFERPLLVTQSIAALLCAGFLAMAVKSFIDVRRSRKTGEHFQFPLERPFARYIEFSVRIIFFEYGKGAQACGHAFFRN